MTEQRYSASIDPMLAEDRLPELGPGVPNLALRPQLAILTTASAFPQVADVSMARACLAGLWLLHDFLDESHAISQDLATPEGSCWHAIMHRREPDAWNSKYWWGQVGEHPVLEMLQTEAPKIGYPFTTPHKFVDFCERVRGSASAEEDLAKRVQFLEWQLLFNWCWNKAL